MEKVVLTKQQSEIFETYKKAHDLMTILKRAERGFTFGEHLTMNDLKIEDLANAWINGYEIEEKPEENLLRIYESNNYVINGYEMHFKKGIKTALNVLNIKVEGINC